MAYKFQVGAATLSGSVTVEKELTAQHDIESSAGAVKVAAGQTIQIGNSWLTQAALKPVLAVTGGTALAGKAVVLDGSKDIAGFNDVSAAGLTLSDLEEGGILFAGSGGVLNTSVDNLQWAEDRDDNDGYIALFVSSSASGSAQLGDGMLMLSDENDADICAITYDGAQFAVDLSGSGDAYVGGKLYMYNDSAELWGGLDLNSVGISATGPIADATTVSGTIAQFTSVTASFSGSFEGNGSALYGVSADTAVTDKSDNVNYRLVAVAAAASAATLITDDDANFTFNPSTKRVNLPGKLAVTGNVDLAAKLQLSGAADLGTNTDDVINVFGQLTASLGIDLSEQGLHNVGAISCDSIGSDTAGTGLDIDFDGNTTQNKISLTDDLRDALNVNQGGNSYLMFRTENDEEEIIANETFAVSASSGPNGISIKTNGYQVFEGLKSVTSSFNMAVGGNNPVHGVKHSHYLMSASAGTVTLTLPDCGDGSEAGVSGLWLHVKRHSNASAGTYEIASSGSQFIDHSTDNLVLESAGAAVILYGYETNWHIW